jgi:hypothetical protein
MSEGCYKSHPSKPDLQPVSDTIRKIPFFIPRSTPFTLSPKLSLRERQESVKPKLRTKAETLESHWKTVSQKERDKTSGKPFPGLKPSSISLGLVDMPGAASKILPTVFFYLEENLVLWAMVRFITKI